MDLLLLIKDLLTQKDLIGMFTFTFIISFVITKDANTIIKVLRKVLVTYIIFMMLLK